MCILFFARPALTSISSQAGLFSAVLTAFFDVSKIQGLKVNPADQSAYYQNQTVHMLDRISQQFASVDRQISSNYTPPLPYPTFRPSVSDRRVNILWLISLICSLSSALLATLVQQWARAYMRIFQQSKNPLKAARIRLFLLEGAERLPSVAEFVPGLIHISLILFLWGLCDIILYIDKTVFFTTVVPILVCVCLYIYCMVESIRNPQSPYRTPFSPYIWRLIQILRRNLYNRIRIGLVNPVQDLQVASMEGYREQSAMEQTEGRRNRDVHGIQWLVNNINGKNEMQAFVLAISSSFNQEWGRDVWKRVLWDDLPTFSVGQSRPGLPSIQKRTTIYRLSRFVQNFFESESEGDFMDSKVQRTRMRGCIETAASLVCCADVQLDSFGEVAEVLSKVGDKERTNDPSTIISNPFFTIHWTCLSLVAIWKVVDANMLQDLAEFVLDGFSHLHTVYYGIPDMMDLMDIAQRIDGYRMKAWVPVVDLYHAFDSEPWSLKRTESDIITILNSHEESISELERIANEAVGVEHVDWRISFFQERMDGITHKLIQRLPGVFFNKLESVAPIIISEAFGFPSVGTTPVPPPLIFPRQQIQSLCTLGRRLRYIIEGQNTENHEETLKSLRSPSAKSPFHCADSMT